MIRTTVALDPRRAAGGHAPDDGVWELRLRVQGPGLDRSTELTVTPASPGVPAGTVAGVRVSVADPADGNGDGNEDGNEDGNGLALRVEATPERDSGAEPRETPLVSVVLPVGDDPARLAASLASLTAQTWPPDAYEVIVVGPVPDRLPDPLPARVRLLPGGGADPRDTGAAAALGTYLFFLTPGDRLGEDALRRMYAYGLEHDADIVAGKLAGAKGRPVPKELYARDRPAATPAKDPLADSLTADKLFDRAMVVRHGIRFGDGEHPLAEQEFTVQALSRARRTAVLGSYVCCAYGDRPPVPFAPGPYYAGLRRVLATADRLTAPGAARDRLHRRWLRVELLQPLGGRCLLDLDEAARDDLLAEIRTTLDGHVSPTALAGLPARHRLTAALVTGNRTDELLELARWEGTVACVPLLRELRWREDGTLGIGFTAQLIAEGQPLELAADEDRLSPGSLSAGLRDRLATEPLNGRDRPAEAKAVLVLRARASGAEYRLPTRAEVGRVPAGDGTETVLVTCVGTLDPGTALSGTALADGVWDLRVRLDALGWTRTAPLGSHRVPETALAGRPHPDGDGRTVTPYWTRTHDDLALRVGHPEPEPPQSHCWTAAP